MRCSYQILSITIQGEEMPIKDESAELLLPNDPITGPAEASDGPPLTASPLLEPRERAPDEPLIPATRHRYGPLITAWIRLMSLDIQTGK